MEPCKFFLQGRCVFGSTCMKSHEATAVRSSPFSTHPQEVSKAATNVQSTQSARAVRICKFFAEGKCTYGAACRNSHGTMPLDTLSPQMASLQRLSPRTNPNDNVPFPVHIEDGGTRLCRFFQQGTCAKGMTCEFSHEVALPQHILLSLNPTSSLRKGHAPKSVTGDLLINSNVLVGLRPNASTFTPAIETRATVIGERYHRPPCHFFDSGGCRSGQQCAFRYEVPNTMMARAPNAGIKTQAIPNYDDILRSMDKIKIGDNFSRDFHGASVEFKTGAAVSLVKLPSDFSSIQILGLPANATSDAVLGLLDSLGYRIPASCIQLRPAGPAGATVEVKVEDATFARTVTQKFEKELGRGARGELSMKSMLSNISYGALANRLQMSSVTCTWFKASRRAWLQYGSQRNALDCKSFLGRSQRVLNRDLECTTEEFYSRDRRQSMWTVQVGNLDGKTKEKHFCELLKGRLRPQRITFSDPTHSYSDSASAIVVERLLGQKGELESFQHQALLGSGKIKATASFFDREGAARAVKDLHNTTIPGLGGSKFFISHVISVKYNVPSTIIEALRVDLEMLKESFWQRNHIHLKSYPQTDPSKPFSTVRIFGDVLKDVAEAKAKLETTLNGIIVGSSESTLWDPYFLKPVALTYLNDLGRVHKLYIHRDARKSQLRIYGGSKTKQAEVAQLLARKIESLHSLIHRIPLTPNLLRKAMQGGMCRLKARFGEGVTLDVSQNPKIITISGSIEDAHDAQVLLLDDTATSDQGHLRGDGDCVVCWSEATNPLHIPCGHKYCRDCFESQIFSAGNGGVPVCCCGEDCLHIFSIDELKTMLSSSSFDALLNASFDAYIRTHPKDFQFCPTPDCPQVYRTAKSGEMFTCSICLTAICTACNIISHDGMSCEEYQDISSEGNLAFQKWKESNGAKDCPNCTTSIMKSEGCNHMQCHACKIHICWVCMETFADEAVTEKDPEGSGSRACYSHMSKEHGGFFDRAFI